MKIRIPVRTRLRLITILVGVYVDRLDGAARFHWVSSPTTQELTQLSQTIARRVGRYLEHEGLLERDAENSYLTTDTIPEDPMNQLLGHAITYRIAVGPRQGAKYSLCRHYRPVNPMLSLISRAKYPVSPYMRACRQGWMNARNWSVFVDTSAARQYRKGACR